MASSVKPGSQTKSNVFLLVGVVAILGGIALVVYGLAPAKPLMETISNTFGGGTPPSDLSERMDAAMAELKARALADIVGFIAILVGFVLVKQAFAKPKPKSMEQLVQDEVARRMAAVPAPPLPASAASIPPIMPPTGATPSATLPHSPDLPSTATQQTVAVPAPTIVRRTHCATCDSVLVAGGRICPRGHPQA